jgi:hypothetical protein
MPLAHFAAFSWRTAISLGGSQRGQRRFMPILASPAR